MPRSSLCKGSDGIRSPKSKDKFSGRVALSPLDDLVKTVFPVSIVVSTGSLVEVEVDQVVIGQCSLLDEVIHFIKTLHLYVFEITFRCNPCSTQVIQMVLFVCYTKTHLTCELKNFYFPYPKLQYLQTSHPIKWNL